MFIEQIFLKKKNTNNNQIIIRILCPACDSASGIHPKAPSKFLQLAIYSTAY